MYYHFNKEIYIVKGAAKSCIYDLPNNRLHKLGVKAYEVLAKVIDGADINKPNEIKFMNTLVTLGLVSVVDNPLYDYESIEQIYSYKRELDFAWIEITNRCNLRCVHCYNEHGMIPKTVLTLDAFKHIVDQLCSIGIKKVQLIGGEPFLLKRDLMFSMMDYLSPRVKGFELFTNGTIATREDWTEIKGRYPNVSIATSLHSYLKEEHEKVTQVEESFNKTKQTIKILEELDIPHRFVGTYIGGICIGSDCELGKPSRRDFVRLSGKANLSLYDDDLLRKRIITEKTVHSGMIKEKLKALYEESCFATHLYIGSDLNIYPCPMERRLCHGNIMEGELKDMLVPSILNYSKNNVHGCKDCEYRYLCRDCRPDSLYGLVTEKPWYCTYDPYRGKWESFDEFKQRISLAGE